MKKEEIEGNYTLYFKYRFICQHTKSNLKTEKLDSRFSIFGGYQTLKVLGIFSLKSIEMMERISGALITS